MEERAGAGRAWGSGHKEYLEVSLKRVLWGNVPTRCPFRGLTVVLG